MHEPIDTTQQWDDETLRLISWLEQASIPDNLKLGDYAIIQDGATYKNRMLAQLERGPGCGNARAMAWHLRQLHQRLGNTAVKT